ncbi:SusC/RagA family TonB-linked outer membrane protein [Pedobacter hiemivivus]|uniref:SusC/RagA family TonB-linked outer membrane protein n=1 Tax=Pedobacter hiemivivus TaxID=2530454 RepID=A0A4R0MKH5_9SPHI|nr:SusC/RagA family TonB-linked outer membrane protein [Pedobacter hiemivivus]TCC86514.1 SusC/RagA family TonB-linked outer membrane protein [Pedobacter hiemivivus]
MKKKLLLLTLGGLLFFVHVFAQQKTITGKVSSSGDGLTIPGASVKIKGTKTVTQTNALGVYSIQAKVGDVLMFSYIGMQSHEQTVAAASLINVVLKPDTKSLNEVVVTAYGIERDAKSLGYSTPKVKGDEVSDTQRESFFAGLQGRVPGLTINPSSGDPGASSQIVLRGFVSMSGNNSPLIVVDGLPIDNSVINQTDDLVGGGVNRNSDYSNRALDLNPADIENYVIMKGPEATALYGNLGASGAILITTKKGKVGKGTVNYSNAFNVTTQVNMPDIQRKYNQGESNGIYSGGSTNFFGPVYPVGTKIYNNLDQFLNNAFSQTHNLNFEGGSEKFTYRWSNQFAEFNSPIPNTRLSKFSTKITAEAEISPLLKLTTTMNYMNNSNRKPARGISGYLFSLMRFPSQYDINDWQDEKGDRVLHVGSIFGEYDNPFWSVYKNTNEDKTNRFIMNNHFRFTPNKWLSVLAILGADIYTTNGIMVFHAQSYSGSGTAASPTGGSVSTYDKLNRNLTGSITATAKQKYGNFSGTYVVGGNVADNYYTINSMRGDSMYDPNFYNINNTLPTTQRARNNINNYRTVGAFAQAIMGYKSILYLTLSGRVDGASRLMPNNPYFAYPAASVAFNFSDLDYFKKFDWLSGGKIRGSAGMTGKEPWKVYGILSNFTPRASSGGGFAYDYYGGNELLKPETTTNVEAGFELQLFKNRFGIDFNYYYLLSKDQIIQPRTSYATGYVLRLINGGKVENRGVEIQLNANPVRSEKVNWDLTLNFARNRGTVISIADELPELYNSDTWINTVRSAVFPGKSTGSMSGLSLDRNNRGDVLIDPATGLPYATNENYMIIGDRTPNYTLGIVNRFRIFDFSLSFLWDFSIGGDVYNGTEHINYVKGISPKTLDREQPRVVKGILKDGLENTDNPTPNSIAITPYYNSRFYGETVAAQMFVEKDINTIRLRDITLSYRFSKNLMARMPFLKNVSVYTTLTDVLLFTNYSGMDPESNSNNAALGGVGGYRMDFGNMGRPLAINFGLNVKL